jgi:hypothetical protein
MHFPILENHPFVEEIQLKRQGVLPFVSKQAYSQRNGREKMNLRIPFGQLDKDKHKKATGSFDSMKPLVTLTACPAERRIFPCSFGF